MSAYDLDLFVIGAGSGGVRAARIAAGYGARVMVAEEFRIGGTCVIRGCVPKKLMVYASRFRDEFEDAAGFGWTVGDTSFDWKKLVAAKEAEITRLSGIYRANLLKAGVQVVESRAEIVDAHHVSLLADGRILGAAHILVATGGAPHMVPEIPGLEHAVSSNGIFDLPEFPKRLLVVGGGFIDEDIRVGLSEAIRHAGVDLRPHVLPTRIDKAADGLVATLSNGDRLAVDQVLVATGRAPHVKGLGLEAAGVAQRANGAIVVDDRSRTNVASIYAVGDVTDRVNLTPVAIREGHAFADNVFGGKNIDVSHADVPSAVFTTPEVGTVGLTEAEAREAYAIVDIYSASFRPMRATLSGRSEKTIMKIVVDGETDRVLGVHILGHEAGEMAQLLGVAVRMRATKADFDATMAVHPTAAEELVTMRTRTARHMRPA